MKARMAASEKASAMLPALAKARSNTVSGGEIAFKGACDVSPGMGGCSPKMVMRASVRDAANTGSTPTVTLQMTAVSEEGASKAIDALQGFIDANDKLRPEINKKGNIIFVSFEDAVGMFSEEMAEPFGYASSCHKKAEVTINWSSDFSDMINYPDTPLRDLIGAISIESDIRVGAGDVGALIDELAPVPGLSALVNLFVGAEANVKLGYHAELVKPFLHALRPLLQHQFRHAGEQMAVASQHFGNHTLAEVKEQCAHLYKKLIKVPGYEKLLIMTEVFGHNIASIDSVTLGCVPGAGSLVGALEFENFNPFPVFAFLTPGSGPTQPGNRPTSPRKDLCKNISPEEKERIREVFNKYDKDGSGAIDLQELQKMVQELGGTVSEKDAKGMMAELDKNGQGTCNFDEFLLFWTSKPSLGGYSSIALRFLKMKLAANTVLGKLKPGWLLPPSLKVVEDDDTCIKISFQCSPGMTKCSAKTTAKLAFTKTAYEAPAGKSKPRLSVRFKTISLEKDKEAVAAVQQVIDAARLMVGDEPPCLPAVSSDEAGILISLSPPEELFTTTLLCTSPEKKAMETLLQLIQSIKTCGVTVMSATSFEEILASPDKLLPEVFAGMMSEFELSISSEGKKALLDLWQRKVSEDTNSNRKNERRKAFNLLIAFMRAFAGLEVDVLSGYHQDNIRRAVKMAFEMGDFGDGESADDMMMSMATIAGLRKKVDQQVPDGAIEELGHLMKPALDALSLYKSVESISVEAPLFTYTSEDDYGDDRKEASGGVNVACKCEFENFNPFCIMQYLGQGIKTRIASPAPADPTSGDVTA
jgi:hypothetical protein